MQKNPYFTPTLCKTSHYCCTNSLITLEHVMQLHMGEPFEGARACTCVLGEYVKLLPHDMLELELFHRHFAINIQLSKLSRQTPLCLCFDGGMHPEQGWLSVFIWLQ